MKCEDCRWFKPKTNTYGPSSSCRRFAPQIVIVSKEGNSAALEAITRWPVVSKDDFCGEFQSIITEEMEAEAKEWAKG